MIAAPALLFSIGFGLAVWAWAGVRKLLAGGGARVERWPVAARSVMTAREQALFRMLLDLYPDHVVLAQVALSRFIDVRPGTPGRVRWRNRISRLVADFVLCTKDFSIVAVIELDEPSGVDAPSGGDAVRPSWQARKAAVTAAGLRLVRIESGPLPAPPDLRRRLELADLPAASETAPISISSDPAAGLVSRPMRRPTLAAGIFSAVAVVALAVLGARLLYTRAHPAVRELAASRAATAAPRPMKPPVPVAIALAEIPVVEDPAQAERTRAAGERAALVQSAAVAEEKRKDRAWAEFFKPDESCEHPSDWAEQVECGNQYIRARKAFDKLWHSQQGHPGVLQSPGQNRAR